MAKKGSIELTQKEFDRAVSLLKALASRVKCDVCGKRKPNHYLLVKGSIKLIQLCGKCTDRLSKPGKVITVKRKRGVK